MKKLMLLGLLCGVILTTHAQILSPTVISSGGNYSSASGVSLSYTIGEMAAVQTFTGGNTILTQGFQQPEDKVTGLLDIERGPDGAVSVFPVPATNSLWFGYEYNEKGKVEVTLFDMLGKQLDYTFTESYETGKVVHHFDCSAYAAGNYILNAKFIATSGQENTISKKFQIINQ